MLADSKCELVYFAMESEIAISLKMLTVADIFFIAILYH